MADWEVYKTNVDDMEIDTEEEDMTNYLVEDNDYNYIDYKKQAHSYSAKK